MTPSLCQLSEVHDRPFGSAQGTFQITALLVGGFRAGKMNGTGPNGGLTRRRVIEGVFHHGPLVELCGGKAFAGPIFVKECRWLRRWFSVDGCKLGENCLDDELLVGALHRRYTHKAG